MRYYASGINIARPSMESAPHFIPPRPITQQAVLRTHTFLLVPQLDSEWCQVSHEVMGSKQATVASFVESAPPGEVGRNHAAYGSENLN